MTVEACGTLPSVAGHFSMIIVHIRLIVLMTENALENCIIRRIDVAIGAGIPLFPMFAGIDREVLRVMVPICRRPSAGCVAALALGWEIGSLVIGVGGAVVSGLVARVAQHRRIDVATGMTIEAE